MDYSHLNGNSTNTLTIDHDSLKLTLLISLDHLTLIQTLFISLTNDLRCDPGDKSPKGVSGPGEVICSKKTQMATGNVGLMKNE